METFGPMVMVGLGGVLVELVGDVVFSLAPIGIPGALELLDRLAGDVPRSAGSPVGESGTASPVSSRPSARSSAPVSE